LWGFTPEQSQSWTNHVLSSPILWAQLRLPLELWQHPKDVCFFPSAVLPLVYQPPNSVITIHDVAFLFFPECFSGILRKWLSLATRVGTARARKIITVSEATRQDLLAYYPIAPEKVCVVHHGVHEMFRALDNSEQVMIEAVKKKYGIERNYLLCIGTLQRRKNIPRLLQAFYLLKQKHHIPHQLVLIGQQCPDLPEAEIFSTIDRLVLTEDVIWTGYVSRQDMPALLNGAKVFVLPSLYEGFGMPLLEAMACGVPVACSNTSSFPEVVGECGAMFDPYDIESMVTTLSQILMNEDLRSTLRDQGFQRVKMFSWERCARETLDILESVCYEK
jgi:glycosyltransferase involved in cell wall biosynthesis